MAAPRRRRRGAGPSLAAAAAAVLAVAASWRYRLALVSPQVAPREGGRIAAAFLQGGGGDAAAAGGAPRTAEEDEEHQIKLSLVRHVKKMQRFGNTAAALAWKRFCEEQGGGSLSPWSFTTEALQQFLKQYAEVAGNGEEGAAGPTGAGDAGLASIGTLAALQQLHKLRPVSRWQWARACRERGEGISNPKQQTETFVRQFLAEVAATPPEDEGAAPPPPELLARVAAARCAEGGEDRWRKWSKAEVYSLRDPRCVPRAVLERFLEGGEEVVT